MSEFKKGQLAAKTGKPDEQGTIIVKIFRRDPKSAAGNAVMNGRKEEIVVEGSTVGKVYAEINKALFGDDEED